MPSDPINPLEAFAARGLAWAMPKMARSVTIAGVKYYGARTELSLEGGEISYGGRKAKRAFSILIPKGAGEGQMTAEPKEGTTVLDDLGRTFTLVEVKVDAVQFILTCGGAWG